MAIVEVSKKDLLNLVGRKMPDEEIEEKLFLLKCEVEFEGDTASVEVNPDRPDMLSVEGIARAMRNFLEISLPTKYAVSDSKVSIKGSSQIRPFIAGAVIKNVNLTDELVKSLMQIQEKLHLSLGRKRKKVAIGVHDFDMIKPPLEYKDVEDASFVPLGESREMIVSQILEEHPKGMDYAHLLERWRIYPMIYDKEGVISFPPIINSERTKVTEKTKNLFIDVTGTDLRSVEQVLNILVTSVVERSGVIESIRINRKKYPNLDFEKRIIQLEDINELLGIGLKEGEAAKCFERTGYNVLKFKGGKLEVLIPPYRADILHDVDLIEDVAIGYGYNNIKPILPKLSTIGSLSKKGKFTRKVRDLMVGLGFQEVSNLVLTSKENDSVKMKLHKESVEILNPVSNEYDICRTWLLPGLLKVLAANKHVYYPQLVFEVGDCVILDEEKDVRTKTVRKLSGAVIKDTANLTEMRSMIEAILKNLGLKYEIKPFNHDFFIKTRSGDIFVNNKNIGFFGEINPEVLNNWMLDRPVIGFEIDLERIMEK